MTGDQQGRKATVTTPTDREIHIERILDAPRERVYAAFTDPELIPQWWGPHGTTAQVAEMDVRAGDECESRVRGGRAGARDRQADETLASSASRRS